MNILVSACLLGENCKYNGGNNLCPKVVEFVKENSVCPVCPEVIGQKNYDTTDRIYCVQEYNITTRSIRIRKSL